MFLLLDVYFGENNIIYKCPNHTVRAVLINSVEKVSLISRALLSHFELGIVRLFLNRYRVPIHSRISPAGRRQSAWLPHTSAT